MQIQRISLFVAVLIIAVSTVALPTVSQKPLTLSTASTEFDPHTSAEAKTSRTARSTVPIPDDVKPKLNPVVNGLETLLDVVLRTLLGRPPNMPDLYENRQIVCFLYDRFLEYSSVVRMTPDHPRHSYFSASRFVAWRTLLSSCDMLQFHNASSPPMENCTLESISEMCLDFNMYQLRFNITDAAIPRHLQHITMEYTTNFTPAVPSIRTFLEENIGSEATIPPPLSPSEVLLATTTCTTSGASFSCPARYQ